MRSQIWHPLMSPPPERVPTVSCLTDALKSPSGSSSQRHFSNWYFCAGPGVSICANTLRVSSPFPSSMVSLDIIPGGCQSLVFQWLISLIQYLRIGMPVVKHQPPAPREKFCISEFPPDCVSHLGWVFSQDDVSASSPHLKAIFFVLC